MNGTRGKRLALALALLGACGAPDAATETGSPVAASTGAEAPRVWEPAPGLRTSGAVTPQALASAKDEGFTSVIDLRAPGEASFDEAAEVAALGMRYVSIPVAGKDGVTVDNAHKLAEALAADAEGRVLLHCGSGNRAGALLAMKAFHVDGLSAEEALALGKSAGLSKLEPVVRERLVH